MIKKIILYIKEEQKALTDNIIMKLYDIEKYRELYYKNNKDKKTILLTLFTSKDIKELESIVEKLLTKEKRNCL